MTKNTEIVLVYESLWDSLVTSFFTYGGLVVVIGLGVYLESSAMQWAGFIFVALGIWGRAAAVLSKNRCTSIAQARQRLDEIERNALATEHPPSS